ncbi:hypothetical protein MBAV_001907, partial [Candidatus Magnetobacterium bavaricum]
GLSTDRFFFVPGNHDIDRDKWNRYTVSGVRAACNNTLELNEFFDTELKLNVNRRLPMQRGAING